MTKIYDNDMDYKSSLIEIESGGLDEVPTEHLLTLFKHIFVEVEKRGVEFQCNEYSMTEIGVSNNNFVYFD